MNPKKWVSHKWGVTAKLVALFVIFGIVPMMAIWIVAYIATGSSIENNGKAQLLDTAEQLADKIDRNLFERYGDVQAFAMNEMIRRTSRWYDVSPNNPISKSLDGYVKTYGIYSLMIIVDLDGNVIAVNQHDAAGNPIKYRFLYQKNYQTAPWFQALKAGKSTTKTPFTASGNDVSTGTFIEDLHVDPDVKEAYPGGDGLTLSFSAPVFGKNGAVIAYWSNRTDFAVVENMFKSTYQELKRAGLTSAEMTLLDKDGRIIVDYDPMKHGTEDIIHDLDKVIMKLNLSENGVEAAAKGSGRGIRISGFLSP